MKGAVSPHTPVPSEVLNFAGVPEAICPSLIGTPIAQVQTQSSDGMTARREVIGRGEPLPDFYAMVCQPGILSTLHVHTFTTEEALVMQNSPSQVRTGNISPTISGPHKDKDVLVVSGLVVSLAAAIGAFWYFSSTDPRVGDQLDNSAVTEILKDNQPVAVSVPVAHLQTAAAVAAPQPGAIHADLYFEVGRKGLSDEARKELQEDAALLKGDENLGVLIQGYTDQQGSAGYNLTLGRKRAEAVKTELLRAGVAEHQMKMVSLGKEGALCIDSSDVCRRMNRRVHLEIRPIGREHMMPPAVAVTTEADVAPSSADSGKETGDAGSLTGSVLPAATASPDTHNGPSPLEPASGS